MTRDLHILVKCTDCEVQRVPPADVTIRLCLDNDAWSYRFVCPNCHRPTVAETWKTAANAALDAGSPLERWTLPAELDEHPDGPPLTPVDVLDFLLLLREPTWFDQVLDLGRNSDH